MIQLTTPEDDREAIVKNFVLTNDNSRPIKGSVFQSLNQRAIESKDNNGIQLSITRYEAIGLIVFKIDNNFDDKTFALILEALIAGNSVVICSSKQIPELLELKEYLHSSGKDIIHLIDEFDSRVEGNTVITVGAKPIGLYLQQLDNISQKSFVKFTKSIALSFGDISFAK